MKISNIPCHFSMIIVPFHCFFGQVEGSRADKLLMAPREPKGSYVPYGFYADIKEKHGSCPVAVKEFPEGHKYSEARTGKVYLILYIGRVRVEGFISYHRSCYL